MSPEAVRKERAKIEMQLKALHYRAVDLQDRCRHVNKKVFPATDSFVGIPTNRCTDCFKEFSPNES